MMATPSHHHLPPIRGNGDGELERGYVQTIKLTRAEELDRWFERASRGECQILAMHCTSGRGCFDKITVRWQPTIKESPKPDNAELGPQRRFPLEHEEKNQKSPGL